MTFSKDNASGLNRQKNNLREQDEQQERGLKILFTANLKEHHYKNITASFPSIELVASAEKEVIDKEIKDTDILVAWGRFISKELLQKATKLEWIHALSTGVDEFLIPEVIDSSVILTNSRGIHREQMSEHVFSFLLAFVRRQFDYHNQKQDSQWQSLEMSTLANRTIGILGLGALGEEIARKAKAFDMKVLATKETPRIFPHVDEIYSSDELDKILPEVDYLVLTVPLTEKTKNMIGEHELRQMKETAFLVNVARGEVVDEQALYRALKKRWLAGAGLDVFSQEPLPGESPLWNLDNCYITPHVGGASPDYVKKAVELFKRNLTAYLGGNVLPTEVDKTRGY
ncbi:D-2-hydroxyacid dehydrogenase [Natranaerobius thermophilus]|uniref:D-isomer specific 2-hydroxyacid dehydrogenase NAD-binding n=1 Tax=Natranaerobius thermophilus (strain ATCC BAA-1301 / DSM 18059 / JW/NM-WN-LF) TaxID=457570 RepID=B2A8L5_NATTJ|nr:D-2-hydroxyacid dehydrogenase [Natranaerobius thermophilus]ACB85899.1 D-isomer specific 2-hydroxyacid dehydrogenase NAD-binding [Natranaerobius thermophilus JW/NM-WN-LF]